MAQIDKGGGDDKLLYMGDLQNKTKRKVTVEGVLRLLSDLTDEYLPTTRLGAYRRAYAPRYFSVEDYFPSQIERVIERLERQGKVKIIGSGDRRKVVLEEAGKQMILDYDLKQLQPKTGKWDGKWRVVFFDVMEPDQGKRDRFRRLLKRMGFRQMQKSVWVIPYDWEKEIKYIREVLGIPHGVKYGVLESVENDSEMRNWFDL